MKLSLETMKAKTAQLDIDGIDFASFREHPLSPGALRCVRYMHDIEYHTVCYLRDLLVTKVHQNHEVSSFLTFWAFEEYWHGEALGQVLLAHEELAHGSRIEPLRTRIRRRDAWRPLLHGTASAIAGQEWLAVHMSWGAVNEWTTQAGYARLGAIEGNPVLSELLRRIMRQEGRHIDFYASQAKLAMESNRRAQKLVRMALRRFWKPVGAGVMPDEEVAHLTTWLFSGDEGRDAARRVDRQIERLPGCEGLELLQTALGTSPRLAA